MFFIKYCCLLSCLSLLFHQIPADPTGPTKERNGSGTGSATSRKDWVNDLGQAVVLFWVAATRIESSCHNMIRAAGSYRAAVLPSLQGTDACLQLILHALVEKEHVDSAWLFER